MAIKTDLNAISQLRNEGSETMERALESFRNGDYTDAEQLRQKANEVFDRLAEELNKEENELNSLYGESRNFGIIYQTFEHNIQEMMKTPVGKKVLSEAIGMIKSDKNLKGQFNVYQSIVNGGGTGHPEMYVESVLKLMPTASAKSITESNDRFIKALRKLDDLNEYFTIDDKVAGCYEAVDKLLTTKVSPETMADIVEAKSKLVEFVTSVPAEKYGTSEKNIDSIIEAIKSREDFATAEEYQLYREIMAAEDKKALFEQYRNETLDSITSVMNESTEKAAEWQSTYDRVKKYTYDKSNPVMSIAMLAEIRDVVENGAIND